jgi:polyprenyl-phospho-N-acetylgalactosaminyl synthase
MFVAVVPAYNEEEKIGGVVRELYTVVDLVIVIDDGSLDMTRVEAEGAGAMTIRHCQNRGQGAALETGHEYARRIGADYILDYDGDGQFSVDDILPALDKLKSEEADLLLGSRFLGTESALPFMKRSIILPLARLFHRVFYGMVHSDAHNGFRIYTRNALESIRITQDNMAHATEIPAQAVVSGMRVVEYPVSVRYHTYGQSGVGSLTILRDLFFGKFNS